MPDRLPSLTALRAFEAAARYLSFAAAADELSVTPAALSFQIKSLETDLGHPLFVRKTRAIELTEAGAALAPWATQGMDALRHGWRVAQNTTQTNRLTVTAGPAFTSKWLAPRLGDFARQHPDVELRLSTSLEIQDFDRDGIDVAIRFGSVPPHTMRWHNLMEEFVTPMARPSMVEGMTSPADLLQATLISDTSLNFMGAQPNWQDWFALAGIDETLPLGPTFNQADHAVDMALQGGGVALTRFSMGVRALREGALVAPFPLALRVPSAYRIVTPMDREDTPAVAAFRAWLTEQTQGCEDIRAGFDIRDR